jgi:hypothetical protein
MVYTKTITLQGLSSYNLQWDCYLLHRGWSNDRKQNSLQVRAQGYIKISLPRYLEHYLRDI